MIRTRKNSSKNLRKFCIYIWEENSENGKNTFVDHVGDTELYEELRKRIIMEEWRKLMEK